MNTAACRAIENIPALDQRDALALADEIIDDMIAVLQRDHSISSRSFIEWSLVLANLRARIAERITNAIAGHVDLRRCCSKSKRRSGPTRPQFLAAKIPA